MLLLIVAGIILLDQSTKYYIRNVMPVGDSVGAIPGIFHITHVQNPGASFGILPNQKILFVVAGILVIAAVLLFYRSIAGNSRLLAASLGLVVGGASGNLIDRIVFGKVTDFLDFLVWPVFNVADSAIFVGVGLLGIYLIKDWRNAKNAAIVGE